MKVAGAKPKLQAVDTPLFIRLGEMELTPISWLIKGLLEADTMSAIVGPSGSCKSFVALDMALSITSGKDYNGKPVTQGTVLFCAGEGKRGVRKRAKAWCKHYGYYLSNLPMYLSQKTILMHDLATVEAIKKEAAAIGDVKLIIIDTLHRSFGGHNENNPQDMGAFIQACDDLKESLNCTVIIVHHTGHSAADRARGHSSFYAALDGEILTKPIGDTNIQISCTKMKDAEPFKTMEFLKVTIPLGIEEDSLVLELVPTREKPTKMNDGEILGLNTFSEALEGQETVSKLYVEEWRPFFYAQHTGDNKNSKRQAFSRARGSLIKKGYMSMKDDYYSLRDKARHAAT
ncbi:helicase RepA family protein [Paracoccaceae bacterium]|nr:helicase RepA family protein [Paracoccaceae bacterium]